MTTTELTQWGRTVQVGEYLATYDGVDTAACWDCALTEGRHAFDCVVAQALHLVEADDPGSRCGYSDMELDAAKGALAERGLVLATDDCGLIVRARTED